MLPDHEGVDILGLEEARRQALLAIKEVKQPGDDWSGWTLVAVDDAGSVLFTLDLDSLSDA